MSIKFTKLKILSWLLVCISSFIIVFTIVLTASNFVGMTAQAKELSEAQLDMFAQNNILFYDPDGNSDECISFDSVCGSNTKEKLWTSLRQHFDEVHAAAALGNILHEGGLNPLRWEYKAVVNGNPPTFSNRIDDWNKLYDGTYMKECYDNKFKSWYCIGVGDFAITSGLDKYLQYIAKNEPDLFDYFKDPQYTYMSGDELITKLGETTYDRLIALEVKYFIEEWLDPDTKKNFEGYTDVGEAAKYYSRAIMACDSCKTDSEMNTRATSARAMYNELKGFSCTSNSSSSVDSNSTDITLIGDSISVMSEKELEEKFPNSFLNMVGSRHPTSGGDCSGDDGGGLAVLDKLAKGTGTVAKQHSDAKCDTLNVSSNSLKNNVVWELGTNTTGANESTVNKIIGLVGKNRRLFLVTPYNRNSNLKKKTETIAQIYRNAANANSNVYIIDWANAIKDNDSKYLSSDGYHPNSEGSKLLANLIFNAVSNSSGPIGSSTSNTNSYNSSSPVSGNDITWIGDSYSILAKDLIDQTFPGVDYGGPIKDSNGLGDGDTYIASGKCVDQEGIDDNVSNNPSGLAILERIKNEGKLRPYLVFALGDNRGWTQAMMDKFLKLVGNDTQVILVTAETYNSKHGIVDDLLDGVEGGNYNSSNAILRKAAAEHPNIHIADWATVYKDEYYPANSNSNSDGSHPSTGDGFKIWVETIKNTIAPVSSDGMDYCSGTVSTSSGLTEPQAQKLADYYNGPNVDGSVLSVHGKFNCVSFPMWFVQYFTDLTWVTNNGKDVANGIAVANNGLAEGNEPRPFAIFSVTHGVTMCGDYLCGHTGIVVAVNGNDVMTIEASYSDTGPGENGHIEHRDISYFTNDQYGKAFTYIDSKIDQAKLKKIIGN